MSIDFFLLKKSKRVFALLFLLKLSHLHIESNCISDICQRSTNHHHNQHSITINDLIIINVITSVLIIYTIFIYKVNFILDTATQSHLRRSVDFVSMPTNLI